MMTRVFGWLACVGAVVLLVVAMVTGTTPATAATAGVRVSGVIVRLPVVPGRPGAAYFTLTAGAAPVELTGVTSPLARVELHGMSMAGGVMRMDRLPSVRVAAGATVRFAAGGQHLMLFDIPASVRPGATLPLTFVFADGARLRADATIAAATGPMAAMPGMHGAR